MISERGQMGGRGSRGGVARKEESSRGRKHIDMGKRYGNGIQRSALSPASQLPSVVRLHPPSPLPRPPPTLPPTFPAIPAKKSHYLLLEETFRALCNIASPEITANRSTTRNRGRVSRFATPCAVQITRGCTMKALRASPRMHKYMYIFV